jgi:hypothetical protein
MTTVAPESLDEVKPARIVPASSFRTGVFALVMITVIWRYWTMSGWSWFQDDWLYMTKAAELPLWEYLTQNYNGHIMPGQFALAWAMVHTAPLNYSYAVFIVLAFIALSILSWAAALRTIFGERGRLLYMLVVLALSPIFMPVSLWWAAGIQVYPLQLFMGLAVLFTGRYMLEGRRRADLFGLAASYVLGLLFWEKALLIAVPVAFVAVLLSTGRLRIRVRDSRWVLGVIAAITLVYLPAYIMLTRNGDAADTKLFEKRDLGETISFFFTGVLDVGVPALLGGPWYTPTDPQQLFAATSGVMTLAFLLLLVAGIAVAIRMRRSAPLMIAMAVTYAIVAWGLLFTSSRFDALGVVSVRDGRHAADILPVALLTLTFLFTPTRLEAGSEWHNVEVSPATRHLVRAVSVGAVIAVLVSAVVASGRIWDSSAPASPKTWVDNFLSDATSAGEVSVYDSRAPDSVVAGWFGNDARVSKLLKPLDLPLSFNEPAPEIYVADWAGHLKEADIEPVTRSVSPGPVPGCGYLVEAGQSVTIPLQTFLYDWQWGLQVDYFTAGPAALSVETDNKSVDLVLDSGLAHRQAVVEDSATKLVVTSQAGSSTVCITEAIMGPVKDSDRWIREVGTAAP